MSEATAAAVTETVTTAPPPAVSSAEDDLARLLKMDDAPPKKAEPAPEPKPEPKTGKNGEPEHLAAANGRKPPKEPIDPLDPKDFEDEKLSSPEAIKAARERIQKAQRQALELTRAAHRSHAAAEAREKKLLTREAGVGDRETRAAAWERAVSTAIEDLESGDTERFLTAVQKLSKSGDPAGFWRNASLSLAKGEKLKPAQAAQVAADPELRARLEQLEQTLNGRAQQEHESQVEQLKTRNFEAAKANSATPRVVAYASDERAAGAIRERLAEIQMSAYRQHGRPIDISQACEILENELSVHFELSQRADGKTNGEKGTTGPEPDAGRETSKDLPKPETSQVTIPAALSSSPASANRSMNEEERRQLQIRQLESLGIFD